MNIFKSYFLQVLLSEEITAFVSKITKRNIYFAIHILIKAATSFQRKRTSLPENITVPITLQLSQKKSVSASKYSQKSHFQNQLPENNTNPM